MTITIKVADGKTLTFNSLAELGKHYGLLADEYYREGYDTNRVQAYSFVAWQLQNALVEDVQPKIEETLRHV